MREFMDEPEVDSPDPAEMPEYVANPKAAFEQELKRQRK